MKMQNLVRKIDRLRSQVTQLEIEVAQGRESMAILAERLGNISIKSSTPEEIALSRHGDFSNLMARIVRTL